MTPAYHFPGDAWRGATDAGWKVQITDTTGSTNTDLLAQVAGGAPDRSVLVAGHQSAGRGRLDRTWDSPAGANLMMSILFRDVPSDPGELTRRVGLAAVAAAQTGAGLAASLKWPNDVLIGDEKLAGILAARHPDGPVVVGIGMNVRWAPPGAARLGDALAPADAGVALLLALDALPADSMPAYRAALGTIGQRVRVERPAGTFEGRALDVEADGRLVVLDDCAVTHRLDAADVTHLRPV